MANVHHKMAMMKLSALFPHGIDALVLSYLHPVWFGDRFARPLVVTI